MSELRPLYDAMRAVLAASAAPRRFLDAVPEDPGEPSDLAPADSPGRAALMAVAPAPPFEAALALAQAAAPSLHWRQSYRWNPALDSYLRASGYIELTGRRGHFGEAAGAFGLGVTGPGAFYPDHRHPAEEVYLPLAGSAEWRIGAAGWRRGAPGDVVHTPPMAWHAIRTTETLVYLYVWIGGDPADVSEFRPASEGGAGR